MINDNDNDLREKIFLYFKKGIKSHIVLNSGQWYNGLITEFCEKSANSKEWIMFKDRKIDSAFPIQILDIKEIDPFMEEKK